MNSSKPKVPQKGAVKRLREFNKKNRGKPSNELLEILQNSEDDSKDKKSARPSAKQGLEI